MRKSQKSAPPHRHCYDCSAGSGTRPAGSHELEQAQERERAARLQSSPTIRAIDRHDPSSSHVYSFIDRTVYACFSRLSSASIYLSLIFHSLCHSCNERSREE